MKRKGTWRPHRSLGSIKLHSEPILKLPGSTEFWQGVEQVAIGGVLGAGPVLGGPCVTGKGLEAGLAVGLGLTGLFWLLTGANYLAISGVVSALGSYAVCKLKSDVKETLTSR